MLPDNPHGLESSGPRQIGYGGTLGKSLISVNVPFRSVQHPATVSVIVSGKLQSPIHRPDGPPPLPERDPDLLPEPEADPDLLPLADGTTEPEPEADPEAEPDLLPELEPDALPEPEDDPALLPEPEADPEVGADPTLLPEPDTDTGTEPDTDTDLLPDATLLPEAEPEPEAEPDPEPDPADRQHDPPHTSRPFAYPSRIAGTIRPVAVEQHSAAPQISRPLA